MDKPLEITFRNLDRSEALSSLIEEKCGMLERFYHHIISLHVTVEAPHRRHLKGNAYRVVIEAHVPGKHLVTGKSPGRNIRHENLIATVNDSFQAIARQLEDYARIQRGDVKRHKMALQDSL